MKIDDMVEFINREIVTYLEKYSGKEMKEPMGYSLKAGGKRFRPLICLLTCHDLGKDYKEALPFAIAIEFIHTYSLIHDDLPSMDNDDFRRGKLTCHKKYDEATAILAGDGLLNLAFEIMLDALNQNFSKEKLECCLIIANASGTKGMIRGQALDIKAENSIIEKNELLDIYENKTGKLIIASMLVGAIIGGADEKKIITISKLAYNLGIAFQLQDDILDVIGDEKKIGKPLKSDLKNNKSTYVSLYGLEKAKEDYKALSNDVLEKLEELGFKDKPIYKYIKSLIDRES